MFRYYKRFMTRKNTYNPMSKEFQDEYERLGLTGRQLTEKYRKEGRSLEKGTYKMNKIVPLKYTDDELLWCLIQFYEKYGKPPTTRDFTNNSEYPSFKTYVKRFGSWSNALKLVGMDLDTRVMQGHLDTTQEKARFAEIKIINHFKQHPTDLSGGNCISPCDGICPNGKTYDVKSSKLYKIANGEEYYLFSTRNKYKEEIEIYYFVAFNEDWTKLEYVWRVPGEIVGGDCFKIWVNGEIIKNMEEYNITNKFKEIFGD